MRRRLNYKAAYWQSLGQRLLQAYADVVHLENSRLIVHLHGNRPRSDL